MQLMRHLLSRAVLTRALLTACLAGAPVLADVLPDDRADAMYHLYDGGGVTVQGPSVLIRKKVGDNLSLSASYYEDMISSASIDVKLSASPYHETRRQWGGAVDYQHGKTIYTVGVISSDEPDYEAKTAYYSLSQSMFGDLTTVTIGFRRGWDQVMKDFKNPLTHQIQNDPAFGSRTADHRSYTLGVSQVLTRNLLFGFNWEKITDQGYLANPYRQIRYVGDDGSVQLDNQIYPRTRTSDAFAGQLKYYLPYRAAVTGSYRFYTDTWGIRGNTGEIGYTQPWSRWTFDASVRYYTQTSASFYGDLFPRRDYQNFMARDRELAAFDSVTVGFGVSYELPGVNWLSKSTVNVHYDRLMVDYSNFTNPLSYTFEGTAPGALYHLDADVLQVFVSLWF